MNKRKILLPILPAPALLFRHVLCLLALLAASALADGGTNQALNSTETPPTVSTNTNDNTNQAPDLTQLSLEQLMQIKIPEVYSASKFEQKASEAPSSVTVITSDEIKRYGWRTLGDLLASVQGFYVSYDRNYDYLGTRGVNLG
ncbi:MAG TPA: Plug domain-containing protein, partial [Candidatus Saccharimonadales bacterium]|nr:Plug domain-containing protein [Candidatus Saccharimonadales bacterium]